MIPKFALSIGGNNETVDRIEDMIKEEFMNDDSNIEYDEDYTDTDSIINFIFKANISNDISKDNCGCEMVIKRIIEIYPDVDETYIDYFCFTCNNDYEDNVCKRCEIKNCDGCCLRDSVFCFA